MINDILDDPKYAEFKEGDDLARQLIHQLAKELAGDKEQINTKRIVGIMPSLLQFLAKLVIICYPEEDDARFTMNTLHQLLDISYEMAYNDWLNHGEKETVH